ncbi:dihydroorotate dehydrogenase electron transfer subunit [Oscillospiraceae bacterium MB08-C2-2]|nr:dihydroorotate dehydrogenase electron transfer subunit [Oscillospiraceae bacterium MB08-C2-2]
MSYSQVKIISNRQLAPGIFKMELPAPEMPLPGQFYMLRPAQSRVLLPRAISVCDWADGVATLLYQLVGEGTIQLSQMQAGEPLGMLGPIGGTFPIDFSRPVALVGGGIGTAPLVYLSRRLKEAGITADAFLGYRDTPYFTEQFEPFTRRIAIATETGEAGTKGFVTALFDPADYEAILCCGPTPMMKAVNALGQKSGVPVYVSLENKMACGVGACLACTCGTKDGKYRRVCKDGPVFLGEEVDFEA